MTTTVSTGSIGSTTGRQHLQHLQAMHTQQPETSHLQRQQSIERILHPDAISAIVESDNIALDQVYVALGPTQHEVQIPQEEQAQLPILVGMIGELVLTEEQKKTVEAKITAQKEKDFLNNLYPAKNYPTVGMDHYTKDFQKNKSAGHIKDFGKSYSERSFDLDPLVERLREDAAIRASIAARAVNAAEPSNVTVAEVHRAASVLPTAPAETFYVRM